MKEVNRTAEKSIRCNGYTFVIEVRSDQVNKQYDAFITIYKGRVEVGGIGVSGDNHKRAHFPSAEAAFTGAERFLDFTTWGTGRSRKHTVT